MARFLGQVKMVILLALSVWNVSQLLSMQQIESSAREKIVLKKIADEIEELSKSDDNSQWKAARWWSGAALLTYKSLLNNPKISKLVMHPKLPILQSMYLLTMYSANWPDRPWDELLLYACEKNHEIICECVLEDPAANVNVSFEGRTPLHGAVERGNERLVKLLLERGADIRTHAGKLGLAPIHLAFLRNNRAIKNLLLNRYAELYRNSGFSPLHYAIADENWRALQDLVTHRELINQADNCGWTPLHWASLVGNINAVNLLLDCGANTEALASDTYLTPLHIAIIAGNEPLVRLLLTRGANHSAYCLGYTPFTLAARLMRLEIGMLLLDNGAFYDSGDSGDLATIDLHKLRGLKVCCETIVNLYQQKINFKPFFFGLFRLFRQEYYLQNDLVYDFIIEVLKILKIDCPICLESFSQNCKPVLLYYCAHIICSSCYAKLLSQPQKICPVCRGVICDSAKPLVSQV